MMGFRSTTGGCRPSESLHRASPTDARTRNRSPTANRPPPHPGVQTRRIWEASRPRGTWHGGRVRGAAGRRWANRLMVGTGETAAGNDHPGALAGSVGPAVAVDLVDGEDDPLAAVADLVWFLRDGCGDLDSRRLADPAEEDAAADRRRPHGGGRPAGGQQGAEDEHSDHGDCCRSRPGVARRCPPPGTPPPGRRPRRPRPRPRRTGHRAAHRSRWPPPSPRHPTSGSASRSRPGGPDPRRRPGPEGDR